MLKKLIIPGAAIVILGLLAAFGPQYIFKLCNVAAEGAPVCHWSGLAEIGLGLLIAVQGAAFILLPETGVRLGLAVSVFFTGIVALAVPHILIGGCSSLAMACRRVAFPALTVELVALLLVSAGLVVYLRQSGAEKG
jgi:hypothetical protein